MRIAFVSDVVYPYVKGGVEATEASEMQALAKLHDVYCISLRFEGMAPAFTRRGVHYIGVAPASTGSLYRNGRRSVALARSFAKGLAAGLAGRRFDVIQANAFPFLHLGAVKAYCRRTNCRLILDVSEVWSLQRWIGYMGQVRGRAAYYYMRSALKGADHYIANSSSTKADLVSIGISPGRVSVFSPVLDGALLKGAGTRGGSARSSSVIFSGRLIPEKRIGLWLEAVAAARRLNPQIAGTIIGEGPEVPNAKGLISKLGLSGSVRLLPFLKTKKELYLKMARSGLFLQTSSREGLSAIVLESLALGTPVLLPDDTPIPEEVKRLCEVAPIASLHKRIADILSSDRRRHLPARSELRRFSTSAILPFYRKLFAGLGINTHE